ncbi:MAG: hypothetical protein NTY68_05545, partial [Candidatus Micrarchaeota archaeon]|nr:hypothetical protein [Candidatus Micrarchaeota archaeon]
MKKLILILALAILMMGCVEKREFGFGSTMKIVNTNGINIDSMGDDEVALYEFTPLSIEISKSDTETSMFSIKKYIFVYPADYTVKMNSGLDKEESDEYLNASESYVNKLYSQCAFKFDSCKGPQTCKSSCTSNDCKASGFNDIGYVIYDFSNLVKEKQRLNNEIESLRNLSAGKTYDGKLAEDMIRLMVVDHAIRSHPAVTKFRMCPKEDTALVSSVNGDFEIGTTNYNVLTIYSIGVSGMKSPLGIEIEDNIPADVIGKIQIKEVPASATYETQPNVMLKFNQLFLNSSQTETLAYPFESEMANDKISYIALNGGKGILSISTPASEEIQILMDLANIIFVPANSLVGMPRMAIMLVFAAGLLILLMAVQLLESLYAVVNAIMKKGKAKNAFLESLGLAMPNWMVMGAAGIVFMFIGIYVESTGRISGIKLIDDNTIYTIMPITSIIGMLGMLAYLISAYLLVDVIFDRIKSAIGGKYYSRNLLRYTAEEIDSGMKSLKQKIKASLAELEDYSEKGIDSSAEYNKIASLSLDELKKLYDKGDYREAHRILDEYFKVVNESMVSIKTKDEMAKANEGKWMDILKAELEESKNERINISTLIEIPQGWRPWIVRKFIDQRKDEGWTLEENILKKTEMSEQERLESFIKSFMKEGTIESGAVFKGTTYAGGVFKSGKQSINMALSSRIIKFILSIAPIVERTKDTVFVSYGKNSLIYVIGKSG